MYINKLDQCFAKKKDNVLTYTVEQHCILTGIISKSLNSIFNYKFKNEAFVIIAAHDIGKIFPIFQFKMYDGISGFNGKINNISKLNKTTLTSADKELNYHSGISSFFFKHNKNICNIISRHHGYTTNLPNKFKVKENDDETFKNLRQEFYEKILVYFNTSDKEVNSYINSLSKMQIELLSNLLVISDWLASSTFIEYSSKIYNGDINKILIKELENIGFYKNLLLKDNLSFNDIFGFMPYASQEKIIKNISGPGVYLIEEEPGRGKTESAFYAAYNMLRFYSVGISPTNHTKNIYKQINAFSKHRLTIVKAMLKSRFHDENFENKTLNQLKGLEGIRVKKLYKELSEKYKISWKGRDAGNISGFNNISIINQYLTLLNQFLYAYVTSVIISLGYSPYIGFIHKGSTLPFTFDIADIFKKEITIEPAFYLSKEYDFFDSDIAINDFLDNMKKFNLSKIIPNTILNLFEISNDVTDELLDDETFNTNILDLI